METNPEVYEDWMNERGTDESECPHDEADEDGTCYECGKPHVCPPKEE